MANKEQPSIFTRLAEKIGSPVIDQDVREELRSKAYNQNLGRDGLLSPMEMVRLTRGAKNRAATRMVNEEIAKRSKEPLKPAKPKALSAWQRQQRQNVLIDDALKARRLPIAFAKSQDGFFSPKYQAEQKILARQEYLRGPAWLR